MKVLNTFDTVHFWLGLIFIGGLLWIFGSFFFNLSFPESDYAFIGNTTKVKLNHGKPVTELFVATENNLDQIKIIIGNSDIQNGESIVFALADATCNTTLAQDIHHSYNLSSFIYYHFNFARIPDSLGKTYCFSTTYYSPFDRGSDRPYLSAIEGDQFTHRPYQTTGSDIVYGDRTLKMRPGYSTGNVMNDLGRLNDRISQYKPVLLKGISLSIIFGSFLLSTFTLVWLLIFKKGKE